MGYPVVVEKMGYPVIDVDVAVVDVDDDGYLGGSVDGYPSVSVDGKPSVVSEDVFVLVMVVVVFVIDVASVVVVSLVVVVVFIIGVVSVGGTKFFKSISISSK